MAEITEPAPTPAPTPAPAPQPAQDTMIPKYRFDEVLQRAQAAEAKIAELAKLSEQLEAKNKRIADLEKELTDTKTGYELEKAAAKKNSAVEAALKDKVVDYEVVSKLLDNDKITLAEDGSLTGLDEQVKALRTSKPFLWKPAKEVVKPGGGRPAPSSKSFAKQIAEERVAQIGAEKKSATYF